MPGPFGPALGSVRAQSERDRNLVLGGMRRSGEASPEASVGSGDPELERLLGTIGPIRYDSCQSGNDLLVCLTPDDRLAVTDVD